MRVLVEAGKAVIVGDAAQPAVETVGPAVIAAGERLLAAGPVDELHAAVPARIAEGARDAVRATDRDNRRQRRVPRDIGADLGERGRRTERRQRAAEYVFDLGREAILRQIMRDGFVPDAVAEIGRFGIDMPEDAVDDGCFVRELCRHRRSPALLAGLAAGLFRGADSPIALQATSETSRVRMNEIHDARLGRHRADAVRSRHADLA